jgi:hypothetical protein
LLVSDELRATLAWDCTAVSEEALVSAVVRAWTSCLVTESLVLEESAPTLTSASSRVATSEEDEVSVLDRLNSTTREAVSELLEASAVDRTTLVRFAAAVSEDELLSADERTNASSRLTASLLSDVSAPVRTK